MTKIDILKKDLEELKRAADGVQSRNAKESVFFMDSVADVVDSLNDAIMFVDKYIQESK